MRKTTRSTLIAALALASAPAAADAADRYVSKTGNPGSMTCSQANPCQTLPQAYTQSQTGDTIHIGPGSFDSEGEDPGTKMLHIVGAGAGTLDAFDPAVHTEIDSGMRLKGGGSVRGVRIDGQWRSALALASAGGPRAYVVEDVVLTGAHGPGTDPAALELEGSGPVEADVRRTAVRAPLVSDADVAVRVTGATLRAEDSTFLAPESGIGLAASDGSDVSLTRSTVSGRRGGLLVQSSELAAHRSRISSNFKGVEVQTPTKDASVTIADSLITAWPNAGGGVRAVDLMPGVAGTTARAIILRSTLDLSAPSVRAGIVLDRSGTGTAALELHSSVVRAVDEDGMTADPDILAEAGDAPVTAAADHSSFSDVGGLDTLVPGSGSNVAGDPMLAGDGTLLAGSPLVDRGDAAALPDGALDLAGAARVQDGDADASCTPRVDIGAFERPAAACTLPVTETPQTTEKPAGGGQTPAADTVKPVIGGAKVTRRTARWTLTEPAAVTIRITRRVRKGGRVRWVTARRLTAAGKAGANALRFKKLKAGRYRATFRAVDAAGNAGTAPRVAFRVR